ncbi:hypothetical protein ACQKP0_13830 [Heyndrickxia sp. NPDC080065]|uniref:hypothetical protein n=1 Tax=Heyndrickxia sp. NPDC080065 TaxID=3390568 RepID=UPI003CFD5259
MKFLCSLFILCLLLVGCGHSNYVEKGKIDLDGKIVQIDVESNRILLEDAASFKTWVRLPEHIDITKYTIGEEVVVWTSSIKESNPADATALNIERKIPKQ